MPVLFWHMLILTGKNTGNYWLTRTPTHPHTKNNNTRLLTCRSGLGGSAPNGIKAAEGPRGEGGGGIDILATPGEGCGGGLLAAGAGLGAD